MHVEVFQVNMVHRAVIPTHNAHAVAHFFRRRTGVGELEVVDLPILLVLEQQRLVELAFGGDQRLLSFAVLIDDDGPASVPEPCG